MRHLFVQLLKEYGAEQDFRFIMEQNGMFSFSGLTGEQVDRLKKNLQFMLFVLVVSMWLVSLKIIFVIYVKAL